MAYGDVDHWGWRAPALAILAVLTALCVAVAVLTAWSRTTLVDTEGYLDALVAPLTADNEVKDAVASELARQMSDATGDAFAERLQQWVPASNLLVKAAIGQFADQIEQGWKERLRPAIRAQLDLPTFSSLWIQANGEAHRQLMDALGDAKTGSRVTLNLHPIAQDAVRETGVQLDQQLGLPNSVGAMVYAAIAAALPPEVGQVTVDVSRVSRPARQAISLIDPIIGVAIGAALILALMAVGAAPTGRQGTSIIVVGLAVVGVAGLLWLGVSNQAEKAGDRVGGISVKPLSPEMHLVIDHEAALAAASFRGWAVATAAGGLALVVIGGLWRLASGRQPDLYDSGSYSTGGQWDETPVTHWSSRGY